MIFNWLSRLPLGVLYALARLLSVFAYSVMGYRKQVVYENLRNSFPEKSEEEIRRIAKGFYWNLSCLIVESLKAISISEKELRKRVKIRNPEVLEAYIARHQSVIVMASHQANWEWLLLGCCAQLSFPIDAVYKPLSSPYFEDLMRRVRSRFGGNPIPMQQTLMEIMRRKSEARGFALVADQVPGQDEEKYWTTFLHQDTAFYVGSERIAQMTKYPVIFVAMRRLRTGYYEVELIELAQPPYAKGNYDIIERYAREAEKLVRSAPSDWLWSHRRWKYKKPLYA